MKPPPEPAGTEQRLLRHARREGLVIMAVWAAALGVPIGKCVVIEDSISGIRAAKAAQRGGLLLRNFVVERGDARCPRT